MMPWSEVMPCRTQALSAWLPRSLCMLRGCITLHSQGMVLALTGCLTRWLTGRLTERLLGATYGRRLACNLVWRGKRANEPVWCHR